MSALSFAVAGARAERFAAVPTLVLRLRITEAAGEHVQAIALRAQVQLEPQRRRYDAEESSRLVELFGAPERYGQTLRPLLWTSVSQTVPAFDGTTEADLTLPLSYDFEVAAHKYLAALRDGEIPLALLFSGMVFVQGEHGVWSELVPWSCEARYRLPVAVWREAIDVCFPGTAWIRIDRALFDELSRFKNAHGLATWDAALARLCETARTAP
ncbi:MAG TPA: DUF6084 family protein [Candidatus Limnocylindria bacterium]|nr:DUF6084 family protein [Candidatus Limnocylindria bacterium]